MRTIIILSLSLVFLAQEVSGQQMNKETKESFKVITYNIWNGFDWGKDELRREKLRQWVIEQKPAVVALQELCKYTPQKLAEDAKSWGHAYSVLLKKTGYSVGLTSDSPIEIKEKMFNGLGHGALHCKTGGIDYLVVHLHPGKIKNRRKEAVVLLKKLEEIRKENSKYIVLGDFNANSPFDAHLYEPDGALIKRMKGKSGDKKNGNLENGRLDFSVISAFLSFPLYDVVREFTEDMDDRGSFPGMTLIPKYFGSVEEVLSCRERIDYIFVSPELSAKCTTAKVCNGEETWSLSDHLPVIAGFKLE